MFADEENQRNEIKMLYKGGKSKQPRNAKSLITSVLVSHTRQAQGNKKPKVSYV